MFQRLSVWLLGPFALVCRITELHRLRGGREVAEKEMVERERRRDERAGSQGSLRRHCLTSH